MESSLNTKKAVIDYPDFHRVFKFPLMPHRNGAQSEKSILSDSS